MTTDGHPYPRTLVVGATFSPNYGVGTYLSQLFTGYPAERLAVVGEVERLVDWDRCSRVYRWGTDEFCYPRLLARANPHRLSQPVLQGQDRPPARIPLPLPARAVRSIVQRTLTLVFGSTEMVTSVTASARLLAWLSDFKPEVIYGRYWGINSATLLMRLRHTLGIPLVIHGMDDWGENMYSEGIGLLRALTRRAWRRLDRKLVVEADLAIGICEEMSRAFEARYGRRWVSLAMPVDWHVWGPYARRDWSVGKVFRIRYGGRVGWSIRDSIIAVARAVDQLCRQGVNVAFEVKTFEPHKLASDLDGLRGVSIQSVESYADLPKSQAAADALLIAYDFDAKSFQMARYSMPGKVAECMASGTPVLVYGPAGLPVVEYARRAGWGLPVDNPSPQALRENILRLRNGPSLRESLGRRAMELARSKHDANSVGEELRRLLSGVVAVIEEKTGTHVQ